MGRPLRDPFDMLAIIADLDDGKTTPLKAYQEYASVAAHPYARSTFELLLQQARRGTSRKIYASGRSATETQLSAADQDASSDAFWANRLPIKPSVLTTVCDNASLRVKGGALIVHDGERGWCSRLPRRSLAHLSWQDGVGWSRLRRCASPAITRSRSSC